MTDSQTPSNGQVFDEPPPPTEPSMEEEQGVGDEDAEIQAFLLAKLDNGDNIENEELFETETQELKSQEEEGSHQNQIPAFSKQEMEAPVEEGSSEPREATPIVGDESSPVKKGTAEDKQEIENKQGSGQDLNTENKERGDEEKAEEEFKDLFVDIFGDSGESDEDLNPNVAVDKEDLERAFEDDDEEQRHSKQIEKMVEKKRKKRDDESNQEFDELIKKKRRKKRGEGRTKKGENEDLNGEGLNILTSRMQLKLMDFVDKMNSAAEADKIANKEKKPAINKLQMLPEVIDQLSKVHLRKMFLDCEVLSAIKLWLDPLPDGSLTNVKIREGLLRALLKFKELSPNQLRSSGIGRNIMKFSQNQSETKLNRKLAAQLIHQWSRPIFEISAEWSDLGPTDIDPTLLPIPQKRPEKSKQRKSVNDILSPDKSSSKEKGGSQYHASIPTRSDMNFTIRPVSNVLPKEARKSKKPGRFEKYFQSLSQRDRSVRALQMSVEGRGFIPK